MNTIPTSSTERFNTGKRSFELASSTYPNQKLIEYCNNQYVKNAKDKAIQAGLKSIVIGVAAAIFAKYALFLETWGILSTGLGATNISFGILLGKQRRVMDPYADTLMALIFSSNFAKFAESKQLLTPETILQARTLYLEQPNVQKEFWVQK